MARRGYFEKENEHLKTHKIKILGRSRQSNNMMECEGRNRLIRRMRNYVPDVRFTGKESVFINTLGFKYKGHKVFGDFGQMSLVPD